MFFCVIGLSLAQIFLGSQVREFLDSLGLDKTSWSDMIQESYISIHKFVGGLVFLFNIILVILLNNNIISLKVFPKEI